MGRPLTAEDFKEIRKRLARLREKSESIDNPKPEKPNASTSNS